ncbi:ATP phosphoribosyltransferase regulatory subunit [Hippea maritima]|uniref:Histidine--tRNA ligase n=1 Tax=Hippea maritima (strain ATCC 700847 / DSM 10411 / MH2) TaxID=760142 RepID=F2LUM6_HIPMA|nr:ATP phosphoribosyltransferase regulatory subunit [Hippea maritima]AEA34616.1 tRNA synthetase class II (G H P and S) [Hippea maritima DSM 10411]
MNRIPSGVVQFFEPLTSIRRKAENTIIEFFKSKGYEEIITPTFVYEDSVSEFLFEPLKNKLFKIVDKNSGQTMILRADITLQITQAVLLGDFKMPARLCYAQNVYRDIKEHLGQKREFKQIGVELFGIKEVDADFEVVSLAIDSLSLMGLNNLYVRVSDTYIIENLIKEFGLNPGKAERLRELVFLKNISHIKKEGFDSALIERIEQLESLSGLSLDNLKDCAFDAANLSLKIKEQYPDVEVFCDLFYCEYPLYHHGITFEIFAENKKLAVGGRYGNITKKLGRYIPATGFAIDLNELSYFLYEKENFR